MTYKIQVLDIILSCPDGITAVEVAERIGRNKASVAGWCSRLLMSDAIHVCGWRWGKSGRGSNIYRYGRRPKNMPQPIKPEERSVHIMACLTPSEHERIVNAARARGLKAAAYMRAAAIEASNV